MTLALSALTLIALIGVADWLYTLRQNLMESLSQANIF